MCFTQWEFLNSPCSKISLASTTINLKRSRARACAWDVDGSMTSMLKVLTVSAVLQVKGRPPFLIFSHFDCQCLILYFYNSLSNMSITYCFLLLSLLLSHRHQLKWGCTLAKSNVCLDVAMAVFYMEQHVGLLSLCLRCFAKQANVCSSNMQSCGAELVLVIRRPLTTISLSIHLLTILSIHLNKNNFYYLHSVCI